jgi:glycosyltransferase involved in cell wall biosynthesis
MRIAIVTDAWFPQVNGVVRSLSATASILIERGHEIELITPQQFWTVPMPGYREIRLAVAPRFAARRALNEFSPDIVHIATEGPIGWSARAWCLKHNAPFTTAFHTRFPDYASVRTGIAAERFWPIMRYFHAPSTAVMVSTEGLREELNERGISNAVLWPRGVDQSVFNPDGATHKDLAHLPRPLLLSVGRVAIEKNLEAFLSVDSPGTKIVVGDGPALAELQRRYPQAVFLGVLHGSDLADVYRSADVFVFPSQTDTFGLVIIEALACGVPVAGFPVRGPIDILGPDGCGQSPGTAEAVGALDWDLRRAIERAQTLSRKDAAAFGGEFDWSKCTDRFEAALSKAKFKRHPIAA